MGLCGSKTTATASAGKSPEAWKATTVDADFKIDMSEDGKLGEGASSLVRRAVHRRTETQVALKIMTKSKLSQEDIEGVRQEVAAMRRLKGHPNIVQLYGFYDEGDRFYLALELVSGGELFDRIVKLEKYSEEHARIAMRQMVEAIDYCHKRGIVHRDLKPENILLVDGSPSAAIKVADFGFAKECKVGERILTTACGTPGYVAPEVIKREKYGREVDIWSLGVLLYILLSGYPPFYADERFEGKEAERELFRQIKNGEFQFHMPDWASISEDAKSLIRAMLTVHPDRRITAAGLLEHHWIKNVASTTALPELRDRLKRFNTRRKMRAAMQAVKATVTLQKLIRGIGAAAAAVAAEEAAAAAAAAGGGGAGGGGAGGAGGGGGGAVAADAGGLVDAVARSGGSPAASWPGEVRPAVESEEEVPQA